MRRVENREKHVVKQRWKFERQDLGLGGGERMESENHAFALSLFKVAKQMIVEMDMLRMRFRYTASIISRKNDFN